MGRHEGAAVNSRDMERDWLGLRSAGPEGTPARGEVGGGIVSERRHEAGFWKNRALCGHWG